nr:hypothetical protein [Propionibacterium sp.]
MTDMQGAGERETVGVPVSRERVERCLASAEYWVVRLPRYADSYQARADFWAIAAGLLAAVTSLSIWPVLNESPSVWAKVLVSMVALASAICALVPRIKGYAEEAGAARVLSAQYGSIVGRLVDLLAEQTLNREVASLIVAEFQAIKEKKDALRGLPARQAVGPKAGTRA